MIFNLYDPSDVKLVKDAFKNKTVGLTSGSFDMTHSTHSQYLDSCRRLCGQKGFLIVGVDSDHLVRERKGHSRPIIPEADRLGEIAGRKSVAAAFILNTALDFGLAVKLLGIKYIFKNQEYEQVEVYGTEVKGTKLIIVPDFQRTESTTALIKKVQSLNPPLE